MAAVSRLSASGFINASGKVEHELEVESSSPRRPLTDTITAVPSAEKTSIKGEWFFRRTASLGKPSSQVTWVVNAPFRSLARRAVPFAVPLRQPMRAALSELLGRSRPLEILRPFRGPVEAEIPERGVLLSVLLNTSLPGNLFFQAPTGRQPVLDSLGAIIHAFIPRASALPEPLTRKLLIAGSHKNRAGNMACACADEPLKWRYLTDFIGI